MKKYIIIYHANESARNMVKESNPEDHKKSMEKWHAWAEKCGDSLVDLGSPLGNGQKLSDSGSTESEGDVLGYSILQAEDMEGAKKLLEGHPHLGWNKGCDIEIYEEMPMPE
jgi:hypothetical protein